MAALVLPDGRPIAVTGSEDDTVRVWDLTTGKDLAEPLQNVGPIDVLSALQMGEDVTLCLVGEGVACISLRHGVMARLGTAATPRPPTQVRSKTPP